MECCKRPLEMPSKTGVPRAEIAAHAFECSVGSRGGFGPMPRARPPLNPNTSSNCPRNHPQV